MDKPSVNKHEVGRGLKRPLFAIGAVALCSFATTIAVMRPVGRHVIYPPQNIELSDNNYAMMTWNMQGKARARHGAMKRLVAKHSLDVMALQEVYGDDISDLQRSFRGWTLIDIPADNTRHKERGGYHNVLMTLGRVGRVRSASISRPYHFEQRSVAIAELPAVFGEASLDVVVGTTHIGRGKRSNSEQFPEAARFIKRGTRDDAAAVVCGDFNRGSNTTQRYFGKSWYVAETENTTPSGHKVDFCLSQKAGDVSIIRSVVDESEKTDHYPLVVEFAPVRVDIIGGIMNYLRSYEQLISGIMSADGNTQRTSR